MPGPFHAERSAVFRVGAREARADGGGLLVGGAPGSDGPDASSVHKGRLLDSTVRGGPVRGPPEAQLRNTMQLPRASWMRSHSAVAAVRVSAGTRTR